MRGCGWTESKGKVGQQPLALRTLTNHPGNQARELRSQTQDLTGPLRHLFPAICWVGVQTPPLPGLEAARPSHPFA